MFPSNFVKLLESPPPQPAKPAAAYPTPQGRYNTRTKGPYTLHTKLQRFFEKNRCENRCPYIKLLKKLLQLWKKVVVCMEENCIFYSFVCSVRGPLQS